jgi:hypothetical protein
VAASGVVEGQPAKDRPPGLLDAGHPFTCQERCNKHWNPMLEPTRREGSGFRSALTVAIGSPPRAWEHSAACASQASHCGSPLRAWGAQPQRLTRPGRERITLTGVGSTA